GRARRPAPRAPRHAPRAHRVAQRRSAARGRPGGDRSQRRGDARVAVTIAVVGAGITGLSAAWELTLVGGAVDVIVLDAVRRPGRMIVSVRPDGLVVEG